MSLGLDILEAVKRGGMNKWKVSDPRKPQLLTKQERREAIMSRILVELGTKQMTVEEVHIVMNEGQRAKMAMETVRGYLTTLLSRGLIKRTGYPHRYCK